MSELEKAFLDWWKEESGWDNPAEHGDVLLSEGQLAKAAFKAGAAWNQRQPHPDTKRLDYFEQAGWSISVSAPTLREAIDKAMEQEK